MYKEIVVDEAVDNEAGVEVAVYNESGSSTHPQPSSMKTPGLSLSRSSLLVRAKHRGIRPVDEDTHSTVIYRGIRPVYGHTFYCHLQRNQTCVWTHILLSFTALWEPLHQAFPKRVQSVMPVQGCLRII